VGKRAEKEVTIAELQERLKASHLAIIANYRGLKVADLRKLRRDLRQVGGQFVVAKNTLLRLAARREGREEPFASLLAGPTAVAFATADPVAVAKVITAAASTTRILQVRGAVLDGKALTPEDVAALATLPPREELLAKMLGSLQAPASRLVGTLSGVARQLVYVLQARAQQLEQSQAA